MWVLVTDVFPKRRDRQDRVALYVFDREFPRLSDAFRSCPMNKGQTALLVACEVERIGQIPLMRLEVVSVDLLILTEVEKLSLRHRQSKAKNAAVPG